MRKEAIAIAVAVLGHASLLGVARSMPERELLIKRWGTREVIDLEIDASVPGPPRAPEEPKSAGPQPVATSTSPEENGEEGAKSEATTGVPSVAIAAPGVQPEANTAPFAEEESEPGAADAAPAQAGPSEASAGTAIVTPDTSAPSSGGGASSDEYSPSTEPSFGIPSVSSILGGPGFNVAGQIAVEGSQGTAAPTQAPAAPRVDAAKVDEVMAGTVIGKNREKGIDLPATGIVVSAVSDATRTTPVPHNTRASFEVKLGPGGTVVGVRVTSTSGGDAAQWEAAAKNVASALAAHKLSLGDAAKSGATIIVGVTVKHVYPTGTAKGADVKPVCANQIINDIVEGMDKGTKDNPDPDAVPIFTDENGRPCIPIGVGGTADAANIGATKQIQVQTTTKVLVGGKEALPDVKEVNKDPFWAPSAKDGPRPVAPYKVRKQKRKRDKKK